MPTHPREGIKSREDPSMTLRRFCGFALACSLAFGSVTKADVSLESKEDETLYLLGNSLGQALEEFQLDPRELKIFESGLRDSILGRAPLVEDENSAARISEMRKKRISSFSKSFLDEKKKAKGAKEYPSGLIMTEVVAGTGESPTPEQTVKVHYHGTLPNGVVFDSSVDRGTPTEFPLNRVIPCWTEGVAKMKVGGKSQLVCPPDLAYGDRGAPPKIAPGTPLVFDVELIEIVQ